MTCSSATPSSLGEWDAGHRFLERNREFVAEVGALEARVRRGHLLDDDAVHDFYDRRIPADIVSTRHFDRWWRDASTTRPELLELTADDLRDADGAVIRLDDYPDTWPTGPLDLPLSYRFAPGEPLDGVTLRVPLTALNQVGDDRARLADPRLPRRARPRARPHAAQGHPPRADPDHGDRRRAAARRLGPPHGRLVDALAAAITEVSGVRVGGDDFDFRNAAGAPADARARARRAWQGPRRRHRPRRDPRPPRHGGT